MKKNENRKKESKNEGLPVVFRVHKGAAVASRGIDGGDGAEEGL